MTNISRSWSSISRKRSTQTFTPGRNQLKSQLSLYVTKTQLRMNTIFFSFNIDIIIILHDCLNFKTLIFKKNVILAMVRFFFDYHYIFKTFRTSEKISSFMDSERPRDVGIDPGIVWYKFEAQLKGLAHKSICIVHLFRLN